MAKQSRLNEAEIIGIAIIDAICDGKLVEVHIDSETMNCVLAWQPNAPEQIGELALELSKTVIKARAKLHREGRQED